jgi:hypothetical protein
MPSSHEPPGKGSCLKNLRNSIVVSCTWPPCSICSNQQALLFDHLIVSGKRHLYKAKSYIVWQLVHLEVVWMWCKAYNAFAKVCPLPMHSVHEVKVYNPPCAILAGWLLPTRCADNHQLDIAL